MSRNPTRSEDTVDMNTERETPAAQAAVPVLQARSIKKVYGKGSEAKTAVQDVSFEVAKGEFVCIVGPSGGGKTTLLRILSGLMPATEGEALFEGAPVRSVPDRVSIVFQDYNRSLFPWLRVNKNVELPLRVKKVPRAERARRAQEVIEAVGLAGSERRYPWQLSGGMQQRVAIARALAHRPDLLLMDEPFASVDAQTRFELEDMILRVRDEFDVTVVLITHDIDEAVYLADRIVVLSTSPSTVRELVTVPLTNPREQAATRNDPEFASLRTRLLGLVTR